MLIFYLSMYVYINVVTSTKMIRISAFYQQYSKKLFGLFVLQSIHFMATCITHTAHKAGVVQRPLESRKCFHYTCMPSFRLVSIIWTKACSYTHVYMRWGQSVSKLRHILKNIRSLVANEAVSWAQMAFRILKSQSQVSYFHIDERNIT